MRSSSGSTKLRRLISALFGIFFMGIAVIIIITSDSSTRLGAITAAVVVGGLGLELLTSALRGKRSLLSRIGPLP
jgi:hypothetical protein